MTAPPTALVVGHGYIFADPPSRNTCLSLQAAGWQVHALQLDVGRVIPHQPIPQVVATDSRLLRLPGPLRRLDSAAKWWLYRRNAARLVRRLQPALVVTMTLYDVAALPWPPARYGHKLACAVLDIPPIEDAGRLDRHILAEAWRRLATADVVWASDPHRAETAARLGRLPRRPLVCHNVTETGYLPEPTWPRDGWLRAELRRQGGSLGETGGCIVLRTGAIGDHCGLDETLDALPALPDDTVFAMMGRPDVGYRDRLQTRIAAAGLQRRAFFWDRPTDEVWKRSLQGADVGHMVHGPFPPGPMQRLHEHNSSQSNNRLFQYMAAGLPIVCHDDPRMHPLHAEVGCFRTVRHERLTADLTDRLRELAAAPALRRQLGTAGRKAHLTKYNWPTQFAPVLDAIGPPPDARL